MNMNPAPFIWGHPPPLRTLGGHWPCSYTMDGYIEDTTAIDQVTFREVLQLDDLEDAGFAETLLEEYFTIAWSASRDMMNNLHGMEYDMVAFEAQKLKGSSITIGFVAIASLCNSILENATDIRNSPDVDSMQKQRLLLRRILIALKNQLRETEGSVPRYRQDILRSK